MIINAGSNNIETIVSVDSRIPQNKLLIVGDAINKRHKNLRLPPKMVSTNLKQAVDSVRGLARLDFDILCIGHGQPLVTDARTRVQELIEKTKD